MTNLSHLKVEWVPSPNFEDRLKGLEPTYIILHYTAMNCGKKAVEWLCNPEAKVSSHYLIDDDGSLVQMVAEDKRAWHAGVSYWKGETDINSCSIGIEIQNLGSMLPILPEFPDVQMKAVESLCLDIIKRHNIRSENILGHSDIAFGRKIDPGKAFNWEQLYHAGVGHWVEAEPVCDGISFDLGDEGDGITHLQKLMQEYGYGITPSGTYDQKTKDAVFAFQSHWRQEVVDGIADISTVKTLEKLKDSIAYK